MKSKTRFSKVKEKKDIYHTGFYRYLKTSYRELVERLGQPEDCTKSDGKWWSGDGKVRVQWAFKDKSKKNPTVLTVYDYKDDRSLEEIQEWHVGSKGNHTKIDELLKSHFTEEALAE